MKLRSLRARLIAGVVIWSTIVLGVSIALAMALMMHNPRWSLFVHNSLILLSGAVVTVAGIAIVRSGLSPFNTLRERLADVREGRSNRMAGEYPTEVSPLVDDLNALLDDRDHRVARAAARAGDLAHGLKTPLAVLAQDGERADAAGQSELAASIRQQVARMRRQVDSHLASARAAAGTARHARTGVLDAANGLVRTMSRLYAERQLSIAAAIAADLTVRVPLEDLEEMLGNLLDNACKWTRRQVTVSAARDRSQVIIHVDDDGAGLEPGLRDQVLQRGVRLDEAAQGSGLGLAIVRDLAAAYGGTLALQASPSGGVRAELQLPAA